MAYQKMYIFQVEDLVKLCTHYFDGLVPMDSKVINVGFNPQLTRMIGIELESKEWEDETPLHLRYDGQRVMSWAKGDGQDQPTWTEGNETPNRQ